MAQRQLQQLELTPDENRYEEQRSARARQENLSQREREQRETRQVLNRLRELRSASQTSMRGSRKCSRPSKRPRPFKRAKRSSGSSNGSGISSSRSCAIPTSSGNAWNKRKTANEWRMVVSRSNRAASMYARHQRLWSKDVSHRLSRKARWAGRQLNDLA